MSRVIVNIKSGCWEWQDSLQHGYGQAFVSGKNWRVHKLMAFIFFGRAAITKSVCHTCDNPKCIAPGHLFLGTAQDNKHDANIKGRGTGKLTPDDALLVRTLILHDWPDRSIAEVFSVRREAIKNLRLNYSWNQRANAHNKRRQ